MKCEFCGGDLSLEAKVCPHCGQVNKHAQQHIRDMEHYKGQFESTQKGVYSATKKYTEITTKVIIISLLVVAIVLLMLAAAFSWDISYDIKKMSMKKNAKEYTAILDEYLEAEDYVGFDSFCEKNYIDAYDCEDYEPYGALIRATGNYVDFYLVFMSCLDSGFTGTAEWMCSQLNYFYESIDLEQYSYMQGADNPDAKKALERMESNIGQMLQTYLGLTAEEVASLKEMSDAQRTVLIEERFTDEE